MGFYDHINHNHEFGADSPFLTFYLFLIEFIRLNYKFKIEFFYVISICSMILHYFYYYQTFKFLNCVQVVQRFKGLS